MKFRSIIVFLISAWGWAQDAPLQVEIVKNSSYEAPETFGKHEIRINALGLIAGPTIEINYERILNPSSGFGVGMLIDLSDNDFTTQNFAITPYYRFYFLGREDYGAKGTFVEIFSAFASAENYEDNYNDNGYFYRETNEFQISLGASLGRKWVNQKGYSFEIFIGGGRYLIQTSGYEAHLRLGFSVGKRF